MIPLISIIKDPTGGWVALFFLLFFAVKVILALVGGDVDADGDLDFDGDGVPDADVNVDGFGFSASDFFSLKGFVNFGVGFSSSWALFGLEGWNAALAVGVGLVTLFLLLLAYRACMKLEGTNVHEKPTELVGRHGQVYSVGNGIVILQIECDGRINELITRPDTGFVAEDFKTGDYAFISRVHSTSDVNTVIYCSPCSTPEPETTENTSEA